MLASVVALSGLAHAQTLPAEPTSDRPRFFVAGPDGVPCNVSPSPNDFQTAILVLNSAPNETGTQAAQRLAAYILQHIQTSTWTPLNFGLNDCNWGGVAHSPDLSPQASGTAAANTICVLFQQFGAQTSTVYIENDPENPNDDVDWTTSQLPFYRESDRFRDYKLESYSTANGSFGFPTAGGQNYRHPFIENAVAEEPPMRAWLCDFLREYRDLQGPGNPFLPDISRFFMDTEVNDLVSPGELRELWDPSRGDYSHNDVRMLEQIYDSRRSVHREGGRNYPDYWSTVPVPGDHVVSGVCAPAFCTLKDIYLRDAEAFGLPIHASGPEAGLPNLDVLQSTRQIGQVIVTVPASDAVNRNIMFWWANVQQRTRDFVMERCLYSVVRDGFDYTDPQTNQTTHIDGFPNALVGNYNTSMHSGEMRHSAIMQDSIAPNDDAWWHPDYDNHFHAPFEPRPASTNPTNMMPACTRDSGIDGACFFRMSPGQSEVRWGSQIQYSFGNFDSPVNYTYPVGNPQIDWMWSRQRNAYARKIGTPAQNLLELRHEVVLRLHRHELESTDAGYKVGGSRQVIPWIQSARLPDLVTYSCAELAQELALIRSKRIKEAILFHSFDFRTPNVPADSWNMNERIIRDVYTPKITMLSIVGPSGTVPYTDPLDLAKVEDTLLDQNDLRRTFDITSSYVGGTHSANLVVDLGERYPMTANTPGLSGLVNDTVHRRDFIVLVECTVLNAQGGTKTNVNIDVVCRRTNNQRFKLASLDGESGVSSGRNSYGEVRCGWNVPNSIEDPATSRVDPAHIEILAASEDGEPFTIKYDLIQVIPYMSSQGHIDGSQCFPMISTAPGAPPQTVQGTVFRDEGFRVAWDKPIEAEYSGGESPNQYLRVYRNTGDPDNPLADITCATYQVILSEIDPPSTPHFIKIWYQPSAGQPFQKLPGGEYQICTFDRAGSQLHSTCAYKLYPRLRTSMTGPIERNPPVPSEFFVITVPTSLTANLACEHGTCAADVDNGSGTGTPDEGVTIDDLLFYLMVFEAGLGCADVDDGSGTGTLDAGVTIDDLLYYLFRFEAGC